MLRGRGARTARIHDGSLAHSGPMRVGAVGTWIASQVDAGGVQRVARMRAIGADGCRAGWVVAAGNVDRRRSLGTITIAVVPEFASVLKFRGDRGVVDMPIGLPETWAPGGRVCDVEARALLGPGRGSSVFPGAAARVA